MMLKKRKSREAYPARVCCIARCNAETEVIIDAGALRLPLCDRHWTQHCKDDEQQERMATP